MLLTSFLDAAQRKVRRFEQVFFVIEFTLSLSLLASINESIVSIDFKNMFDGDLSSIDDRGQRNGGNRIKGRCLNLCGLLSGATVVSRVALSVITDNRVKVGA